VDYCKLIRPGFACQTLKQERIYAMDPIFGARVSINGMLVVIWYCGVLCYVDALFKVVVVSGEVLTRQGGAAVSWPVHTGDLETMELPWYQELLSSFFDALTVRCFFFFLYE
jgi:hypothetical protein